MNWEFDRIFLLCLLYLPISIGGQNSSNRSWSFSPKMFEICLFSIIKFLASRFSRNFSGFAMDPLDNYAVDIHWPEGISSKHVAPCLNSLAETTAANPMRTPYAPHRSTAPENKEKPIKNTENLQKPYFCFVFLIFPWGFLIFSYKGLGVGLIVWHPVDRFGRKLQEI